MGTLVTPNAPGAGFYVDATNPKYAKHYNMLTHVTVELPKVISEAGLPIVSLGSGLTETDELKCSGFLAPIDLRALHGRPWCPHHLSQLCSKGIEAIPLMFSICAHCEPYQLSVGPEGLFGILGGRR